MTRHQPTDFELARPPIAKQPAGPQLKKDGVAVDIISFGEAEENHEKLEALINAVNKVGHARPCRLRPFAERNS